MIFFVNKVIVICCHFLLWPRNEILDHYLYVLWSVGLWTLTHLVNLLAIAIVAVFPVTIRWVILDREDRTI